MPRASAPWSTPDLRRKCGALRQELTALVEEGIVTDVELAAYWPGGAENTRAKTGSVRGQWIWCYASLVRLCDRLRPAAVETEAAERARVDAQVDRPVPVTLQSGVVVPVFPKGYVALEYLTWLDREVTRAMAQAADVALQATPESDRVLALAPLLRGFAVQLWAWTLSHPPADLPFAPFGTDEPEPPAWTATLMPEDLLALYQAHRQVNATRNALVAQLFPDDPQATSTRLSLAGFIGAYAHEKGQDSADLMRRFTVGKIFAQAVGAAQQHEAAMQRAKRPAASPMPEAAA